MYHTTWEASGHIAHFSDPMIDCTECKTRFRADQLIEDFCASHDVKPEKAVDAMSHEEMKAFIDEHGVNCPVCGKHSYTAVREFNSYLELFADGCSVAGAYDSEAYDSSRGGTLHGNEV